MFKKLLFTFIILTASYSFALTHFYGANTIAKDSVLNDDLYIHAGAVVQNDSWWLGRTFTVNGDVTNEGSVINNPEDATLNFQVNGDLANTGTLSCNRTTMTGTEAHYLSSLNPITCPEFRVTNTAGIIATGDISFSNSILNFNNYSLDLTSGSDLILNGGAMTNVNITGIASSNIDILNQAYLENANITDCSFQGIVEIYSGVHFYGNSTNYGTIQNKSGDWTDRTLSIHDNFTNLGTVKNNQTGYFLYMDCYGDLSNDGTFTIYNLSFKGTTPQTISSINGKYFNSDIVYNYNSSSIIAGTELNFLDCYIDFRNVGHFDLETNSSNLIFDGRYFQNGTISGDAADNSLSTITGANNFYFSSSAIVKDLSLEGVIMTSSNVTYEGNISNNGILQNRASESNTITIRDNFINNGTVRNNPSGWPLYINCYGDLTNDGTWTNQTVNLKGTTAQTISTLNGNSFNSPYFNNYNATSISAGAVLEFLNCSIDFGNAGYLDLETNSSNINFDGGNFFNGTIAGDPTDNSLTNLTGANNFSFYYSAIVKDLTMNGIVNTGGGNIYEGNITNNGIFQNRVSENSTITFKDNFINNNTIRNNTSGGQLYINCYGDLTNAGTFTNFRTKINGNVEQRVILIEDAVINSDYFYLTSELATSPYQWYYNGLILDSPDFNDETWQETYLYNKSLDISYCGTYYCETGAGDSRNIIIENLIYETPVITSIEHDGSDVDITWNNIPTALSYNVFSSDDPYADPSTWTAETEVFTNSCILTDQTENKKFYFVKALY